MNLKIGRCLVQHSPGRMIIMRYSKFENFTDLIDGEQMWTDEVLVSGSVPDRRIVRGLASAV